MANNYLEFSVEFPICKNLIVDAIAIDKELHQLDEMEEPEWSMHLRLFGKDFWKPSWKMATLDFPQK